MASGTSKTVSVVVVLSAMCVDLLKRLNVNDMKYRALSIEKLSNYEKLS